MRPVGILGVGSYLPETIRTNADWPEHILRKWAEKPERRPLPDDQREVAPSLSEGNKLILQAMAKLKDDPFKGAVERRIIDDAMLPSEMETNAGKEALARAGVKASEIDFIISFSFGPDFLNLPNACIVHRNLGLKTECMSFSVDAVCNSFLVQLELARKLIGSGGAKYGLLIQSSTISRLIPMEEPNSVWFGDGATAVVVGPVSEGKGVLGMAHHTESSICHAIVCGVPGKKWHEDGRSIIYAENRKNAFQMMFRFADNGRDTVLAALADAKLSAKDVDFLACHQAQAWFREVIQEYADLKHSRTVDTFKLAGNLSAANIPLVLCAGEKEGLLRSGDLVAMHSGGTGTTYSGAVLRWGT